MVRFTSVDRVCLLAGGFCLAGVAVLALLITGDNPLTRFDRELGERLYAFGQRTPEILGLFAILSNAGDKVFLTLIALLGAWRRVRTTGSRRAGLWLVAALSVVGMNVLIKLATSRLRPDSSTLGTFSFPSAHAMCSMFIYGLLVWSLVDARDRTVRLVLLATLFGGWVILIGVSRILLGEHYFSDVLAGFLGGLGFLMLAIDREIRLIRPSRPADPSV